MELGTIIDLALLGVFVIFLLTAVIAFFIGLSRGLIKETIKAVIRALLVLSLFFTAGPIANFIGNFDLSIFTGSGERLTINSLIMDYIYNNFQISPINGMSIYETVALIANAVLAFGVFIIGLLLIALFTTLISTIIYHGVFRWFLPVRSKKDEKKRKANKKVYALTEGLEVEDDHKAKKGFPIMRLPGAFVNAIQEFAFICICFTPLTGLLHIVVKNKEQINPLVESMYPEYSTYLVTAEDSYEKSIVGTMLGVGDIDIKIVNQAGVVDINGNKVTFTGTIGSIFDIARPILENEEFTFEGGLENLMSRLPQLMTVETVDALINNVIASPLVLSIIPPILDAAVNLTGFLPSGTINVVDIDYSNDLSVINSIYETLYEPVINPLFSSGEFEPSSIKVEVTKMSDKEIKDLADGVAKLGSMEIISKNAANILAYFGNSLNKNGMTILPTNPEAYKDIKWDKELSVIIYNALMLFKTLNIDLSVDAFSSDIGNTVLTRLEEKTIRDQIKTILTGEGGILDLQTLKILDIPSILASTVKSIPSVATYVSGIDLVEAFKNLNSNSLKEEVNSIFGMLDILYAEDSVINPKELDQIDFYDEKVINEVIVLLDEAENSILFSQIAPVVLEGLVRNPEVIKEEMLFGLSPYNLNFHDSNFIEEFKDFLGIVSPLVPMLKDGFDIKKLDVGVVRNILNFIVDSTLLNSDIRTGASSTAQKNLNIYTVLDNLLAQFLPDMNIKLPSYETFKGIEWKGENGEIEAICSILEGVKENAYLLENGFDNFSLSDIEDIDGTVDLIKSAFDSKMLSPTFLDLLNDNMSNLFETFGVKVNLNEMRTAMWKDDLDEMKAILRVLQGKDLNNFDFNSLDPDTINAILTCLNKLNLIKSSTTYDDAFGYALYQILESSGIISQFGISSLNFSSISVGKGNWTKETMEKEIPGVEGLVPVTTKGEIANLSGLVGVLRNYNFNASQGLPEGFIPSIKPYVGSKLLRNIFSEVTTTLFDSLNLGENFDEALRNIDTSVVLTMTDAELSNELDILNDIFLLSQEKVNYGSGEHSKLEFIFSHIFELASYVDQQDTSKTLLDDFHELLLNISSSTLLCTKRSGSTLSPIALLIKGLVKQTGVIEEVTFTNASNKDSALMSILLFVGDWEEETSHILGVIDSIQGLSLSTIDLVGTGLDYDKATQMLHSMNRSQVFHRFPITIVNRALEDIKIGDMLVDPDTGVKKKLNLHVHLTNSAEDVAFWDNEYKHLLHMALSDEGGLKDLFQSSGKEMSSVDFSSISTTFFYDLGSMSLFNESRSYLLYNFIEKYSVAGFDILSLFKEASNAPYGENKKVYRFEELVFKNTDLLDANGKLDEGKTVFDLKMLDTSINTILKISPVADSTTDPTSMLDLIDFEKICNFAYCLKEDGTFYRSRFTSELVAGLFTTMMNNQTFKDAFSTVNFTIDFYADDYKLVNSMEGRALKGMLEFMKLSKTLSSSKPYFTKAELLNQFAYFGIDDVNLLSDMDDTSKALLNHFLNEPLYTSNNKNSQIALMADEFLMTLPVQVTGSLYPSLLNTVTTLTGSTANYYQIINGLTTID